jgi:uncharacterized membrane protein YsdA (DUF1294 family)
MRRRSRASHTGGNPIYLFAVLTFGLAIGLAAILWWFVPVLDLLLAWLIAITVVTFLTYGYDKAIAASKRTRVPERVLLLLTLAGGTVGALVGMPLFRHKTAKGGFRRRFWLVVALQGMALAVYYLVLKPGTLSG